MFFKKNKKTSEIKEKHHPFSPSALQRRMRCPASYRIEKDLDDVENEYSRKGAYMHERIAQAINTGKRFKAKTSEEQEIVTKVINYINSTLGSGLFFHTEERLEYKNENGNVLYYGTSDLVAMSTDGLLTIFDWKTGKGVVPSAKDNLQLKAYALAAMQTYNVETCRVCIFNPVNGQNSTYTFKDKKRLADKIVGIIDACLDDNAPFVPGSQCRFCLGSVRRVCKEGLWQDEFSNRSEKRDREREKELDRWIRKMDREVEKELYGDDKPKKKRKKKQSSSGCGCLLLILIGFIAVIMLPDSDKSSSESDTKRIDDYKVNRVSIREEVAAKKIKEYDNFREGCSDAEKRRMDSVLSAKKAEYEKVNGLGTYTNSAASIVDMSNLIKDAEKHY